MPLLLNIIKAAGVVTGVLHKPTKADEGRSRNDSETATKLEFLNLTQAALDSGEIFNMTQLDQAFDSFSNENNDPSRGSVK